MKVKWIWILNHQINAIVWIPPFSCAVGESVHSRREVKGGVNVVDHDTSCWKRLQLTFGPNVFRFKDIKHINRNMSVTNLLISLVCSIKYFPRIENLNHYVQCHSCLILKCITFTYSILKFGKVVFSAVQTWSLLHKWFFWKPQFSPSFHAKYVCKDWKKQYLGKCVWTKYPYILVKDLVRVFFNRQRLTKD